MDAHGDVKLGEDGAQNSQLLGVLLSVERHVGTHQVDDLGAYERDAREMRGTSLSFEDTRDGSGIDGDRRGSRIHVLRGRGPHEVRSHSFERVHVRLQGSRIGVEVLSGSELGRVDEDRDDDVVGERVGLSHELQVSGVQGTHGHHERLRSGQAGERLCQLVARVGEGGTMRHSSILASSALRCVIESLSSRRAIRAGAGFPRPSLRRGVGTTPR